MLQLLGFDFDVLEFSAEFVLFYIKFLVLTSFVIFILLFVVCECFSPDFFLSSSPNEPIFGTPKSEFSTTPLVGVESLPCHGRDRVMAAAQTGGVVVLNLSEIAW